jgi:hypothetical protein
MFDEPSFLVQLGWQGKNRVQFGIDHGYIDGAILSPSDYIKSSLKDTANQLSDESLVTLFDPQFYLPGQGDRDKLNRYDYHDNFGGDDFYSGLFVNEDDRNSFFEDLIDLQDDLGCDGYISPSSQISSLSADEVDDWQQTSQYFLNKAKSYGKDIPVYATLAVSGDHLTDASLRDYLLSRATSLNVDGFYISTLYENPDERLPLRGEQNVETYLQTLLSLTLNRYSVIAANTHQIAHLLFVIGVDAFASGHYHNLRSLDLDRWIVPDDPSPRQRPATRYYSDNLLDEVRPDHLMTEIAEGTSIDVEILQSSSMSPWEDDLFDSGSVDLGWPDSEGAWDHYICSCGHIANQYQGMGKEARVDHANEKIRKARKLQEALIKNIDEHTDELNPDYLEDWENAFDRITSTKQFKRL